MATPEATLQTALLLTLQLVSGPNWLGPATVKLCLFLLRTVSRMMIISSYYNWVIYLAIQAYCPALLPTFPLANASNNFTQTLGSNVSYTCLPGYTGNPTTICLIGNSTNGIWSEVSGNCSGIITIIMFFRS